MAALFLMCWCNSSSSSSSFHMLSSSPSISLSNFSMLKSCVFSSSISSKLFGSVLNGSYVLSQSIRYFSSWVSSCFLARSSISFEIMIWGAFDEYFSYVTRSSRDNSEIYAFLANPGILPDFGSYAYLNIFSLISNYLNLFSILNIICARPRARLFN